MSGHPGESGGFTPPLPQACVLGSHTQGLHVFSPVQLSEGSWSKNGDQHLLNSEV